MYNRLRVLILQVIIACSCADSAVVRHPLHHFPSLRSPSKWRSNSENTARQTDECQQESRGRRYGWPNREIAYGIAGTATAALSFNHMTKRFEPARRAFYFWRRVGPIVLHYRFTQLWVEATNKPKLERDLIYCGLHDRYSRPSLDIVLHLKGLFVKIGQVLSARPDFVPSQYVELLSSVQDSIPQWPYKEVESIVRDTLDSEYGLKWDDVFESMDEEALGSASIGQCHRAVLKPEWASQPEYQGGSVVAVKVMHPGSQTKFAHDFRIFRWLCRLALPGWKPILNELESQMKTEFDYKHEAANLDQVRNNMMASPYKDDIVVPQPVQNLCSKNMLVMEMLEGKKFADAIEDKLANAIGCDREVAREFLQTKRKAFLQGEAQGKPNADELLRYGREAQVRRRKKKNGSILSDVQMKVQLLKVERYVRQSVELLVNVHGHQILLDRCFNGDPHPGNILQLSNGKLGLIDYGQTRRLSATESLALARVITELGQTPEMADVAKIAAAMRRFGFETERDDDEVMAKYAKLFFDSDDEAKVEGCATPQMYLLKLSALDPLRSVPDAAVFVARASYMFRGMGSMVEDQVRTSKYWRKHGELAISRAP